MSDTFTVVVGEKGQITVPAELRKKYGITKGAVLLVEDNGTRLSFIPTIVIPKYDFDWDEEATYADKDIAAGNVKRYSSDDYLKELNNRISEKEQLLLNGQSGEITANYNQQTKVVQKTKQRRKPSGSNS